MANAELPRHDYENPGSGREKNPIHVSRYESQRQCAAADKWLAVLFINLVLAGPQIETVFLLGFYCGRKGFFRNTEEQLPLFRKGLHFGLGFGLPMNLIAAWMASDIQSPWAALGSTLMLAFWSGAYMRLHFGVRDSRATRAAARTALASRGRRPHGLTNYLTQSIVCTFIFYSYGLGLYGQVGAAGGAVLSIAIWLIQMRLSVVWLRKFQFGPMEWLWRTLTYGAAQPMRKSVIAVSESPIS